MKINQLANCPKCGKLFVKGIRDICPACHREEEEAFAKVVAYLRDPEHKGATIYEVSEATGVSVKLITKFIRQGRISLKNSPNLGYPCESCGELTTEGNLCPSCRAKFTASVQKLKEEIERKGTQAPEDERYEHVKYSTSVRERSKEGVKRENR